ncbi:hypothetical protein AEAC466_19065 [Asticcacaulis sp. AC466]|uniref:alpha/beta fold hydrolase n=1 Tax=Asticcacaulis sp. AC466 TaxID=1282362 RepID=UPI0003C3C1BA|nr:alpha/beta hydrolase [Asticcacaulis sp. AC466]ESQ82020.1 hypothetical protein AEAC466_19065 [Asticcacaulis sp. AC466]
MRRLLFAFVGALCLSGSVVTGSAQDIGSPILQSGGIYIVPPDHSCAKYAVALSPGGHSLIAWHPTNPHIGLSPRELADDFTIAALDADCLLKRTAGCKSTQFYVTSPTVHSVYWSGDGQTLFVINGDGLLFSFRIAAGEVLEKQLVGKVADNLMGPHSFTIATSSTTTEPAAELERLTGIFSRPRLFAQEFRKTNFVVDRSNHPTLVGESPENLGLFVLSQDQPTANADILSTFTGQEGGSLPFVLRSASGNRWLIGQNNVSLLQDAPANDPERRIIERFENGSWPIIDTDTGLLVGIHSETTVLLFAVDPVSRAIQKKVLSEVNRLHGAIASISISSHSGRAAFALRQLGRGITSEIYDATSGGDALAVAQSCTDISSHSAAAPVIWDGGEKGWALPMRLYHGSGANGLIVFLHGGPASSSSFDPAWESLNELLDQGYDVVTVDPSGSTNSVAQARRLSGMGGRSLEKDARLAAIQIDRLSKKYPRVSLLAESFGGAWAPSLYRHLKHKPGRVALAAPLVRYLPPDMRDKDTATTYSKLFERYYLLGSESLGEDRFPNWLASSYDHPPFGLGTLTIQGDADALSRPEQLPDDMPGVRIVVTGQHLQALRARISVAMVNCWLTWTCDATTVRSQNKQ